MEQPQRSSDCENLETPKNKQGNTSRSRGSGSRRTRSQAGPNWTTMESLILVNEIVAVEGDCMKALSSIQKWKIIADNCTALDVVRTSNQCRRKWDSLLADYNTIQQWESRSRRNNSYWNLESETREEFGLPEDFDSELFDSIDNLVKAEEDRLDTDPDTDPEANAENEMTLDVIAEYGSKRQRRRLTPQKPHVEEKEKNIVEEETSLEEYEDIMAAKLRSERKHQRSMPQKPDVKENEKAIVEVKETSLEENEEIMAAKLRENAELIHTILGEKMPEDLDCKLADLKNDQASRIEFTRRQGDKLIACFGDLVNTLHQLSDLQSKYVDNVQ